MPAKKEVIIQQFIETVNNLNQEINSLKSFLAKIETEQKNLEAKLFTKYTNSNAVAAMGSKADDNPLHHDKYLDAEAIAAVNTDDKYLQNTGDICTGKLTISSDNKETSGSGIFHMVEENDATRFRATTFSNTAWHSPLFVFSRGRGTIASPNYPQSSDVLMYLLAGGWVEDLSTWRYGALMEMTAESNWGSGSYCPTYIKFKTYISNIAYTRLMISSSGDIGVNTDAPTAKLDMNSDIIRLRTAKTPTTAGASGNTGDICWDTNYIYVCTATNTWKRTAITVW